MSTAHKRTTRGTPRPSVTEDDIQGQLRANHSTMIPKRQSPIIESSSGSSHNDDAMDLTYPLPTLPLSSIQVADIDSELSLTPLQSELLHMAMRNAMRDHGILGSLDFRNRVTTEQALKPVLKDVKGRLSFLGRNTRRKDGPGMDRLAELLSARARLIEGSEHRRARKHDKEEGDGQEQVGDEGRNNDNGAGQDHASAATPLASLNVRDAAVAPPDDAVPPQTPASTRARAPATPPFCPGSFIVRVEGSTNGAAVLATQLTGTARSDAPITVEDLRLSKFLELISDQLAFNVEGRILAVLPKTSTVAAIDSKVRVDTEDKWLAILKHWQTWRRKTCEFVVEAEELEAQD